MKFTQVIAPALALATANAAIMPNSTEPSANGFFYQGEIYFQLYLPKASGAVGFSLLSDISGSDSYGFQFNPNTIFGFYQPSSTEFSMSSESSPQSLDFSGSLSFGSDSGAELFLNGPLTTWKDEFVGLFLLELEVGAENKRAEPTPIYVTATTTTALPAGLPFTTTGSILGPEDATTTAPTSSGVSSVTSSSSAVPTTETATLSTSTSFHTIITHSKTTITITSCSDNKCSEVPVETGVTTVTENDTTYTTYCPISEESTIYSDTTITTVITTTKGGVPTTPVVPTTTGTGYTSTSVSPTVAPTSIPEFNGASNLEAGVFFTLVAGLFALVI